MLEAKNVVKTFDGFRALDGVSMTVPQGAVYGLVGPNGAGKSTFLRLLSGKEEPDHGEISVKRGMSVAYLPQTPVLREDDTITQAALDYLPARQGEDPSSAAYEAQTILTQLGFADLNQLVRELSGGQKMRVALAGALCRKSDVLLFDEPTSRLDALNEAIILRSIHELSKSEQNADKGQDVAVVLVSHRESAMRVADAVLNL